MGFGVALGISVGVGAAIGGRSDAGTKLGKTKNSPVTRQAITVRYIKRAVSKFQTDLGDKACEGPRCLGIGQGFHSIAMFPNTDQERRKISWERPYVVPPSSTITRVAL